MRHIFSPILKGFLELNFPEEVAAHMLKPMVQSTVDVFVRVSAELLPTLSKSHYMFNLRDVSRVFQGIVDVRPGSCGRNPSHVLLSLWVHENMRVFYDRLTDEKDQLHVKAILHEMVRVRFQSGRTYEELFHGELPLLFGDFMKLGITHEERSYQAITGTSLPHALTHHLKIV